MSKYSNIYRLLREIADKEGITPNEAKAMAKRDWGIKSITDINDENSYKFESDLYNFWALDIPIPNRGLKEAPIKAGSTIRLPNTRMTLLYKIKNETRYTYTMVQGNHLAQ